MKRFLLFILFIYLLFGLIGCGQTTPSTETSPLGNESIIPTTLPSDFGFIFKYGVGARNELNTFVGTFTKDMILDPSITINLLLSQEELDSIYQNMLEIKFFHYPEEFSIYVPPGMPKGIITPSSSYYFKVIYDSKLKELWWEDQLVYPEDIQADKLRKLISLIEGIIKSKEEYKNLPEPRGGYM